MPTSLSANALTTLATVKAELELNASDPRYSAWDDLLTRYINAASDAIATYCRRSFGYQAAFVENVAPTGGQRLRLSLTPVLSVAQVYDVTQAATVDASTYSLVDPAAGLLWCGPGWTSSAQLFRGAFETPLPGSEQASLQITYAGGYVLPQFDGVPGPRTLPWDLEDACVVVVCNRWRNRTRDGSVDLMPVMKVLERYRRLE